MKLDLKTTRALVERFPGLARIGASARKKVPFVAQHSSVECGVACMAMVLAYHGKHVAREELRSVLGPTRDGVRAAHLLRAARHFGLCARGVKAELDALGHVPPGSVLHWQLNHYVVLQAVGRGYIDIVDPARGPRRVQRAELDDAFTGVALIFEPGADFVANDSRPERRGVYANILRSGDWKRIISVSFAAQLVSLALPLLVAMIVDRVLPRSDAQLLYVVAFGLGLLVIFYWLTQVVRGHLLLHLRSVLDAKLSLQLVDRMLALPYAFFQQRAVGDLVLRLESSKLIREVLTSGALTAVLDGTMMLLYLVLLLTVSPLLTAVVLGLGTINVLMLLAMRTRRRAFHAELIERQAASESYQYEMLQAIETIKGMGGEQRALDRYGNLFVDLLNNQVAYGRLEILFQSLTSVL
ncbi:MAG TPA: cysteine peptidase family C39 domain-containing protein, partial [Polyangiales bacterium]|nr:cysteine peptidase family C39 domain-containing protein [Polyangiales bacterium]